MLTCYQTYSWLKVAVVELWVSEHSVKILSKCFQLLLWFIVCISAVLGRPLLSLFNEEYRPLSPAGTESFFHFYGPDESDVTHKHSRLPLVFWYWISHSFNINIHNHNKGSCTNHDERCQLAKQGNPDIYHFFLMHWSHNPETTKHNIKTRAFIRILLWKVLGLGCKSGKKA